MSEKQINVGSKGERVELDSTKTFGKTSGKILGTLEKQEKKRKGWCRLGVISGTLLMFILFTLSFRFILLDVCDNAVCRDLPNIPVEVKQIYLIEDEKFIEPCQQTDIVGVMKCISAQRKLREKTAQEQEYPMDSKQQDESGHPGPVTFRRGPKQQNETQYPIPSRIRREISSEMNESSIFGNITSPTDEASYDYIDFHGSTSSSCRFPNGLHTAEILCKMWSNSITCKSHCIFGSTYNEGIVRTHFCKFKENTWSQKFEECKPFVNCKLKLVTPGNITCAADNIMKNHSCQISCEGYEDTNGTNNNEKYDCKLDGTWDPPLPSCVAVNGTPLVKSPKVTAHSDIFYP